MILGNTKQRILQYIEHKGISKSQFYNDLDIKRGLLDSDKMNSSVTDIIIAKILVAYADINPIWLLTGEGTMIKSPLVDRSTKLKEVILKIGIGLTPFCERINMDRDLIGKMVAGLFPVSNDVVYALDSVFGIDPDWFTRDIGEMYKSDNKKIYIQEISENPSCVAEPAPEYESKTSLNSNNGRPYFNIDFIGGFDLDLNDQSMTPDYNIDFPPYNMPGVIWCNVTGHSMEPEIENGDIMAIRKVNGEINNLPFGEVYAIATNQYRTIKRVSKSDKEGYIKLIPSNPSPKYAAQDIPINTIIAIFQVLVCVKRF